MHKLREGNGHEDERQTLGNDPRARAGVSLLDGLRRTRAGKVLTLASIGWNENVAVSKLKKVVLEEALATRG